MNTVFNKRQNKLQIILIVAILLILIAFNVVKKGKIIVIEDKAHGIQKEFYLIDNNFKLSYTHSVHKTIFEEYFTVTDDNKILLQKNVFDSFGVGAPYIENPDDLKIENGKFVLKLNKLFNEINMVISPIPKHTLTIGEKEIEIIDLLSEDTNSIRIYIVEKNVILFGNKYHIIL